MSWEKTCDCGGGAGGAGFSSFRCERNFEFNHGIPHYPLRRNYAFVQVPSARVVANNFAYIFT